MVWQTKKAFSFFLWRHGIREGKCYMFSLHEIMWFLIFFKTYLLNKKHLFFIESLALEWKPVS